MVQINGYGSKQAGTEFDFIHDCFFLLASVRLGLDFTTDLKFRALCLASLDLILAGIIVERVKFNPRSIDWGKKKQEREVYRTNSISREKL